MLVSRPESPEAAVRAVSGSSAPPRTAAPGGVAIIPLILTLGLTAGLRLWQLGQNALWVDELASLQTALPPLRHIPAAALLHNAFEPPLYFWLLHGIMETVGAADRDLRVLSAIAGILTVPVVWLLVRQLSRSEQVAGTAALLLAVNPLHVWYSQEARPYALLVFLGSAALLCLARALDRDRAGWWIGYSVLAALTLLVHATGVVYLLVGGIWALHARGRRGMIRIAAATAGTLLLTLPFLLSLLDAVRHATGTGSPERALTGLELPYSLFTFVAGYSFGPPVREIQDLGWRVAVSHYWLESALTGMVLVGLAILLARTRGAGVFCLAALLVTALGVTLMGSLITTKSYNVRYVLPGLVGFVGLAAAALHQVPRRVRGWGLGLALAICGWADIQWFTYSEYWKEDSRSAARCLALRLPAGASVAVAPYYMRALLERYTPGSAGLRYTGVTEPSVIQRSRPSALAITRLYHLPAPEGELVRIFQAQTGAESRVSRAVGYRLYFSPALPGKAAAARCPGDELEAR
jgi:mannosyltransferase